jgi:NADH-quinone oxidoreductase subunit F
MGAESTAPPAPAAPAAAGEVDLAEVDAVVERTGRGREALIPILCALQERYNYLPEPALRRVCEKAEVTPSEVAGVSTFYTQFRHRPAGKHMIKVCIGTACHVKGAETVYHGFRQYLGIPDGEDTDADGLFTVEKVACLGCCMLAPAVQIDDITYGYLSTEKVPQVLSDFLKSLEAGEARGVRGADHGAAGGEIRGCICSSCRAAGAADVLREFRRQAAEAEIPVRVRAVGCTGISYQAPLVEVQVAGGDCFRYGRLGKGDVASVLARHFRPAGVIRRLRGAASQLLEKLLTDQAWEPVTRFAVDLRDGPVGDYWGRQKHIALEGAGVAAPLDLDDYRARGGFEALARCCRELSPEEIIELVTASGLRGRGGAGYPTGRKWKDVRGAPGETRYLICNGDEGDPGAFMDRMILESFPLRVIEGLAIAARAVGATEGFLYIRAEYPLAAYRVREALKLCRQEGIIGPDVMGSGTPLELKVVEGAGAFVCGEETALIAALEGRRGTPRLRPPYPSERGFRGSPTLVNNVETLALVPWIVRSGPEALAALGTEGSKGTKTFALAGKVRHGGLIEIPMGLTLRQIVEEIGGGIDGDLQLKAVQVGGPSGGCVPARLADTPVDYEALTGAGAMMGSGGLVVLDESDCMVDVARYFMTFTQFESCGKCTFCRVGTRRMLDLLTALCEGRGRAEDSWSAWRTRCARAASAAWAGPRPTRCSPRWSTSGRSTRRTWPAGARRRGARR